MRQETWNEAFRTPHCPAPEAILEAVSGSLGGDESRAIEEHCESCVACSAERLLAVQFAGGDGAAERELFPLARAPWRSGALSLSSRQPPRRVLPFPTFSGRHLWVTRLAAGVLLTAGLGGLMALQRQRAVVAPALPDPQTLQVQRSTAVEVVAPRGAIDVEPAELSWREVEAAAGYRIRLLEVDDEVAWSDQSVAARIAVPEAVRVALRTGVPYRWQVEALGAEGSVIARSDLVGFSIVETTSATAAAESEQH